MKKKTKKKIDNKTNIKILDMSNTKIICILLLIAIAIVCGLLLILKSLSPYYSISSRIENVKKSSIEDVYTVGWIRVQGTNIDYPILYGTNDKVDSGNYDYTWIHRSVADDEKRLSIYGHNIRNVGPKPVIGDDKMNNFEQLMSFAYYDFAKENQIIQITMNGKDELYRIYAVSFDKDFDDGEPFSSVEDTKNFVLESKKNSFYNYNVDVNENDDLISLFTCSRFFGYSESSYQFRVDARKIRENEKVSKTKVTKTSNYDIIEEIINK